MFFQFLAARRRHSWLAAALLLSASLSPLVAASTRADDTLVVGQVADLSGLGREFSRDFVAGARTWFDHSNASGLLPGRQIRHLVKDDGGVARNTLLRTRELLEDDNADVLFGYVGDGGLNSVLASDLFRRTGVAMVGAASGLTSATSAREQSFFLRASYAAEAEAVVEQFRLLGLTRFGVVVAHSEFSARVRAEIDAVVRDRKLVLVRSMETGNEERQINAVARQMATGDRPQVILLMADSVAAAMFVKAYRPLDPGISLVALSQAQHDTILQIIGPKFAHGTLLTQVVPDIHSKDLAVAMEHLALMKKYRDEPPTAATFEGFIAAKTLVEAIRRNGGDTSRQGVLMAMRRSPRLNVGGIRFEFIDGSARGARYADIVLLRKDGRLLR